MVNWEDVEGKTLLPLSVAMYGKPQETRKRIASLQASISQSGSLECRSLMTVDYRQSASTFD